MHKKFMALVLMAALIVAGSLGMVLADADTGAEHNQKEEAAVAEQDRTNKIQNDIRQKDDMQDHLDNAAKELDDGNLAESAKERRKAMDDWAKPDDDYSSE